MAGIMSLLLWCALSCFGVPTSARPREETAGADSHSVVPLGLAMKAEEGVTNQMPFIRLQDFKDTHLNARSSPPVMRQRVRRSKASVSQSRRGGCSLGTCTVHDLAHRLNQLNNRLKITQAPLDKISPQGYGRRRRRRRRRRRSLPTHTLQLRRRGLRLEPVWMRTSHTHTHTHTLTHKIKQATRTQRTRAANTMQPRDGEREMEEEGERDGRRERERDGKR